MGTLFLVATPIGNLEDMTLRAIKTLQEADVVYAEDTRVTKKLFARHKIATPLKSYRQQSGTKTMEEVLAALRGGKALALVTDAGTPGISDPGNELIAYLLDSTKTEQLLENCTIKFVPVPGPSAVTALASVSGFPMNSFLFLGFPPQKRGRRKFFEEIVSSPRPVLFYESPHRILKALAELKEAYTRYKIPDTRYRLVVGRELTKQFETVYRGTVGEVLARLEQEKPRGEFAVAVWRLDKGAQRE